MLTKQMRELERQATVVNQNTEHMIQLSDLNHYDDMYYVCLLYTSDAADD